MDFNDICINRTEIPVMDSSENPMVEIAEFNPERRYRVTIRAGNAAGRGPESQPYFFDSATAGGCCYMCGLYKCEITSESFFLKLTELKLKTLLLPFKIS